MDELLIDRMSAALDHLAAACGPSEAADLVLPFDDKNRKEWSYVPGERRGVTLKRLHAEARTHLFELLAVPLSALGFQKTKLIMSLEEVLKATEINPRHNRDPELYYLTRFGDTPRSATARPWGWRFEGHHVSLHFTIVQGIHLATTPTFFGANPAEVRHGTKTGLRVLAQEEDLAREFLRSLAPEQRARAVISDAAPHDILSGASQQATPLAPAGIRVAELSGRQAELLVDLLNVYASNMAPALAARRLDGVRSVGLSDVCFAWAGEVEPGKPHYYRVQGPGFLVEYDNTRNNANHAHSVWRDFSGDFGEDLLAKHYRDHHH